MKERAPLEEMFTVIREKRCGDSSGLIIARRKAEPVGSGTDAGEAKLAPHHFFGSLGGSFFLNRRHAVKLW